MKPDISTLEVNKGMAEDNFKAQGLNPHNFHFQGTFRPVHTWIEKMLTHETLAWGHFLD
jgi:hypothetical protein